MGTIRKGELTLNIETLEPKDATTYKEAFITVYLKGVRQQTISINDKGRIVILESMKHTVEFI